MIFLDALKDQNKISIIRNLINEALIYGIFFVCMFLPLRDDYFKPVLVAVFLVWIVSVIFDFEKLKIILKDRPFRWVAGFFICLFLFGVLASGDFYDNQKYFFYFYMAYFFMFILGRFYSTTSSSKTFIYLGLVIAGLIASGLALWDAFISKKFCYLVGNFGHYNQLGMFVGAILSGTLASLLLEKNVWTIKTRFLAILALPVVFLVLLGSFSRGAWVSFIFVMFLLLLKIVQGKYIDKTKVVFSIIMTFVIISYGGLYLVSNKARERIKHLEMLDLSGRGKIWQNTFMMLEKKPYGFGIRKMESYNAHNQILNIAIGAGWVSALYFTLLIGILFYKFRGNLYSFAGMLLVFMLLHNLVEASLLGIWNNSCLFWLALGLFCSGDLT